jgi:hypothetical protein
MLTLRKSADSIADRNFLFLQCDRKNKKKRTNEHMVDLFEVVETTNNE